MLDLAAFGMPARGCLGAASHRGMSQCSSEHSPDDFTNLLEAETDRVGALYVCKRWLRRFNTANGFAGLRYLVQTAEAVVAGAPTPANLTP